MRLGGTFTAFPADANDNVRIQNNAGNGIRASLHNIVNLNSAVITGNAVDGVTLQLGSAMNLIATSITNNGGHQVRIGDLSVVRFSRVSKQHGQRIEFPRCGVRSTVFNNTPIGKCAQRHHQLPGGIATHLGPDQLATFHRKNSAL